MGVLSTTEAQQCGHGDPPASVPTAPTHVLPFLMCSLMMLGLATTMVTKHGTGTTHYRYLVSTRNNIIIRVSRIY